VFSFFFGKIVRLCNQGLEFLHSFGSNKCSWPTETRHQKLLDAQSFVGRYLNHVLIFHDCHVKLINQTWRRIGA
jgi:hypothetical protein